MIKKYLDKSGLRILVQWIKEQLNSTKQEVKDYVDNEMKIEVRNWLPASEISNSQSLGFNIRGLADVEREGMLSMGGDFYFDNDRSDNAVRFTALFTREVDDNIDDRVYAISCLFTNLEGRKWHHLFKSKEYSIDESHVKIQGWFANSFNGITGYPDAHKNLYVRFSAKDLGYAPAPEDLVKESKEYTDSKLVLATPSQKGLMSSADKIKLNGLQNYDDSGVTELINQLNQDKADKSDLTAVFKYKGSKPTFDDLPTENNKVGDVWNVEDTDHNYAWSGTGWDKLGGVQNPYVKRVNGVSPNENGNIIIPVGQLEKKDDGFQLKGLQVGNTGKNALALAEGTDKTSFSETVVGAYPTKYNPASTNEHHPKDRAFVVGVGSSDGERKDAVMVSKDGRVAFPLLETNLIVSPKSAITKEYFDENIVAITPEEINEILSDD